MEYEDLMTLIDHLDQSSLEYVNYETDTQHVIIAKEVPQRNDKIEDAEIINQPTEASLEQKSTSEEVRAVKAEDQSEEKAGKDVESPMVGVAYLQPQPDEDAYVEVGDQVEKGDVICIIEAMKLMNEIKAPYSGVVTEIFVENEEVVEYKQPLIRIG